MACIKQKSIFDLPDEVIEKIFSFLSFNDLFKLSKEGKRLKGCVKRVSKRKSFSIAILGEDKTAFGFDEVITIGKYFLTHPARKVPLLPARRNGLRGVPLPNGNLLVCGGGRFGLIGSIVEGPACGEYLLLKAHSDQWTNVGTMKVARKYHTSVFYDGCLYTTGGLDSLNNVISHHEAFSLNGDVKEKKDIPISLQGHTATIFDQYKMLICGGSKRKMENDDKPSQRTFFYDFKVDSWTEGPCLLVARSHHSSCAIQADDGSTQCILVLGGQTNQEQFSKSTEILNVKDQKWIQGPTLPFGVKYAACVALPPLSNFACALIGGQIKDNHPSSHSSHLLTDHTYSLCVYGLNKTLTKWLLLGKMNIGAAGKGHPIALGLSYAIP